MREASIPKLPLTGGCQCGQLRYRVSQMPQTLYCCHCTECQEQAASAFGMSLRVPADAVEVEGEVAVYRRDWGNPQAVECLFCPRCGSRVVHRGRGTDAGSSIKAGSLDQRDWLHPVGHIWVRSAQKWMHLDGVIYDGQPDDGYAALRAAFRQRYRID